MFDKLVKKVQEEQQVKPKADAQPRAEVQPFPKQVSVGSVATGNESTTTIFTPKRTPNASGAATMSAHVVNGIGWRNFSVVGAFADLAHVPVGDEPVKIQFSPIAHGPVKTQLTCTLRSENGEVEHRDVDIEGQGVNPDVAAKRESDELSLRKATEAASDAARALTRGQVRAAALVKGEASTYEKAVPPGPWWMDFAMIAVNIASAGIGGFIATKFAPGVLAKVTGAATKKIAAAAGKDIATVRAAVLTGIGESIQTGFVETVNFSIKKGPNLIADLSGSEDSNKPKDTDAGGAYSSNALLDFFTAQETAIDRAGERYANTISAQETELQPLLQSDPDEALHTMEKLKVTCESVEAHEAAFQKQAFATTTQWIAGIAQGVAGKKERMHLDMTTTSVTDFSKGYGVDKDKRHASGLLRLAVTFGDDGKVAVNSAALDGVAQELTDRIAKHPLKDARIPMRIVVTSSSNRELTPVSHNFKTEDRRVWITRDEGGGLTVKGRLPRTAKTIASTELEAADELCREVCSKSLRAWGIKTVNHDDASGRT